MPIQLVAYQEAGSEYWTADLNSGPYIQDLEALATYQKIIRNQAHALLQPGPEPVSAENEMGGGARCFRNLKECGCPVFGRSLTNRSRDIFENMVLGCVDAIARNPHIPNIRVTAFAAGLLFGEMVLLCKIIGTLLRLGAQKEIELNCIDSIYSTLGDGFAEEFRSWQGDVRAAVPDFVDLVDKVKRSVSFKPPIHLRFFPSTSDYRASSHEHHILTCADGMDEETQEDIEQLQAEGLTSVLLIRTCDPDEPDQTGILFNGGFVNIEAFQESS